MEEPVYDFFKTFIDANRMRLAALLLEKAATPEEMAQALSIAPKEIVRHLAQIDKLGLLVNDHGRYRMEPKALEMLSRQVLSGRRPSAEARSNDENADDFDRKTIKNYSLPDGRLREIPLQERKLMAILRHVLQEFQPGVRYTEKQVNTMLARYHEDTAFLRRSLVDFQLIQRENNGSSYWRA